MQMVSELRKNCLDNFLLPTSLLNAFSLLEIQCSAAMTEKN